MENESNRTKTQESQRRQMISFQISNQTYALPIEEVKEVVITPEITPIPLTPDYLQGMANVRGDILAMIDLAKRFGKEVHHPTPHRFCLVLNNQNFKVGLLTSEIPSTRNILEDKIDLNPQIVQSFVEEQDFIRGIINDDNQLIILLNIDKLIKAEVIRQATHFDTQEESKT